MLRRFRRAHAHEQSLWFVNTFLIEEVKGTTCVVLFEGSKGAMFFAFIHYSSSYMIPGEKQGALNPSMFANFICEVFWRVFPCFHS